MAALDVSASDATDAQGNPVGILVVKVGLGGAAEKAGIAAGDIITAVNGQPVTTLAELQTSFAALLPGTTANITYTDPNGGSHNVKVTLSQLSGS